MVSSANVSLQTDLDLLSLYNLSILYFSLLCLSSRTLSGLTLYYNLICSSLDTIADFARLVCRSTFLFPSLQTPNTSPPQLSVSLHTCTLSHTHIIHVYSSQFTSCYDIITQSASLRAECVHIQSVPILKQELNHISIPRASVCDVKILNCMLRKHLTTPSCRMKVEISLG